ATSDSPAEPCWIVPVTHGRPRLPRIVVTPGPDAICAPLAQHSVSEPSVVMSALHAPRGWKHLNAFFVQLFLNTHFAPAGTAMASNRTKAKRNVRGFFVEDMVRLALQIGSYP